VTSSLRDLKVYTTYPHRCSYLEEEEATTLFIDPRQPIDQALYTRLSLLGFRRSGAHVYRPHCSQCKACVPARIPVLDFRPNRSQRRTWRRNEDLIITESESIADDEAYRLYERYILARHADGDMFPPDRDQYESFLSNAWDCTRYYRFHRDGRLLGVAVTDVLEDGLSAIYTFFDPYEEARSLGRHAILWQIEQARVAGLPYVYLGYWIRRCRKMAYKADYRPLELLLDNRWQRADEALIASSP
jgi:arginine-tRNA-protein transferase